MRCLINENTVAVASTPCNHTIEIVSNDECNQSLLDEIDIFLSSYGL